MAPEAMRAELAGRGPLLRHTGAAGAALQGAAPPSTARPHVGNIGTRDPGAAAPRAQPAGAHRRRAAQPGALLRCSATCLPRAGSGGAVHRIDRHPTMRQHPVTPMDEADLRRHLALQGLQRTASVDYPAYEDRPSVLDRRLDGLLARSPDAVLFDVSRDADLSMIGRLIWQRARRQSLLAVGASSVLQALASYWNSGDVDEFVHDSGNRTAVACADGPLEPAGGPVLVLAGSLSPLTAQQVRYAASYTHVALDPHQLLQEDPHCNDGANYGAKRAAVVTGLLREGKSVLVNTSGTAPTVARTPIDSGAKAPLAGRLAMACGVWLNQVLQSCPVTRLAIAGGDTSSHAVQALGAWGLSYRQALGPGVALCRLHSDMAHLDGMELALKGGQMGRKDFFEQLRLGS